MCVLVCVFVDGTLCVLVPYAYLLVSDFGFLGDPPPPSPRPQSLCECFRSPTVLAACGPEPANQTQCLGSIRDHYVTHVHHKYCVTHTEAACQFECQWPLPGFFGDLIAKGVTA